MKLDADAFLLGLKNCYVTERNTMETRFCSKCNELKPCNEFNNTTSYCKVCHCRYYQIRRSTRLESFFGTLLSSAKFHAKRRTLYGRVQAGIFELSIEDLFAMHSKQNGRCLYSGIPYVTRPKSTWQCSLERMDPSEGYVVENVAFVVIELNGRSQWSLEKIQEFIEVVNKDHTSREIDFFTRKQSRKRCMYLEEERDGEKFIFCHECKQFLIETEFKKNWSSGCSACRTKASKEYYNTPRGHFHEMVHNMKSSTKLRNSRGRLHAEAEINFKEMVELWNEQLGLCVYSGLPMSFGTNNWVCSVERIDNSQGYVKGNVCLICLEFNTASGWTKSKVEFFKTNLLRSSWS